MTNFGFAPWPAFTDEEARAVERVLRSNQVNYWTGDEGRKFEDEFATFAGTTHAVALANGTVAIDLALKALGINASDEVIVSPRTFLASVSCIVNAGAMPVFADVDADSQVITRASVEAVLTPNTKAIMCVHLAGWPCEMDQIMELAAANDLAVIEDCAQAHGAQFRGDQKVYDYVIQAMTGMADLQQGDTGSPQLVRQFVVDKTTAVTVSQAITAALFARERGQGGQHVELSMLDIGLWFFWPDGMMDSSLEGDDVVDASHFAEMYSIRPTTDGAVAFVASGNRTWPNLCRAFAPELLDDERFTTMRDRDVNGAALSEIFDAAVASITTDDALQRMTDNDVPGARIARRHEVADDPQVVHNGSLVRRDDGTIGPRVEARPPVNFGDGERVVPPAAPALGADTGAVLASLGYDDERIARLDAAGVLGPSGSRR